MPEMQVGDATSVRGGGSAPISFVWPLPISSPFPATPPEPPTPASSAFPPEPGLADSPFPKVALIQAASTFQDTKSNGFVPTCNSPAPQRPLSAQLTTRSSRSPSTLLCLHWPLGVSTNIEDFRAIYPTQTVQVPLSPEGGARPSSLWDWTSASWPTTHPSFPPYLSSGTTSHLTSGPSVSPDLSRTSRPVLQTVGVLGLPEPAVTPMSFAFAPAHPGADTDARLSPSLPPALPDMDKPALPQPRWPQAPLG